VKRGENPYTGREAHTARLEPTGQRKVRDELLLLAHSTIKLSHPVSCTCVKAYKSAVSLFGTGEHQTNIIVIGENPAIRASDAH
jgi:hypothetical protein